MPCEWWWFSEGFGGETSEDETMSGEYVMDIRESPRSLFHYRTRTGLSYTIEDVVSVTRVGEHTYEVLSVRQEPNLRCKTRVTDVEAVTYEARCAS